MHKAGLGGSLSSACTRPIFITKFPKDRKASVGIVNYTSPKKEQQNGIPHGSVLLVILFALKINSILSQIPKDPRFHYSLY